MTRLVLVVFDIATIVLTVGIIALNLFSRDNKKVTNFNWFSIIMLGMLFGKFCGSISNYTYISVFGYKVMYVAFFFMPVAWYLFVKETLEKSVSKKNSILINIPSIFANILVVMQSSASAKILKINYRVVDGDIVSWIEPNLFYISIIIYFVVLMGYAVYQVHGVYHILKKETPHIYLVHMLAGCIMMSVYMSTLFDLYSDTYMLYTYPISIIYIAYASIMYRDISISRTFVIEDIVIKNMEQPFLLLDARKNVLSYNSAAEEVFPEIKFANGKKINIDKLFNMTTNLDSDYKVIEFQIIGDEYLKFLQACISRVRGVNGIIGYGVVIHDLTQLRLLMDDLEKLATLDPLAEVYNRRTFFELSEKFISYAKMEHIYFSTLMIDIDFFKKVNDTYGHPAGDYVIKELAKIFSRKMSGSDIFARYGGEEFCSLLSNKNLEQTKAFVDEAIKYIESYKFEFEGRVIPITISIGVCYAYSKESLTMKEVLDQADKMLYQAKQTGRNKYCLMEYDSKSKTALAVNEKLN